MEKRAPIHVLLILCFCIIISFSCDESPSSEDGNGYTLELTPEDSFTVEPGSLWKESGIEVEAGEIIVIRSSGTITVDKDEEEEEEFDPEGSTSLGGMGYLMTNENPYALYARIDSNAFFKVGKDYYGFAETTGELCFAVNSIDSAYYEENGYEIDVEASGEFTVDSIMTKQQ